MNKRILRINQLIKKELGIIIAKEIEVPPGTFLTLTRVDCSLDLRQVKVYVSVIPDASLNKVFRLLVASIGELQHLLERRLKMHPVPRIIFLKEEKTKEAAKIEKLLEDIGGE